MIKKIKSSLTLKIFLMMTLVLILVGVIIYAIVMNVMPNNYKNVTLSNYTEEIKNLVEDLEKGTIEDATNKIYDFCLIYSANAQLTGNEITYKFGEIPEQDTSIQTISSEVTFTDSNESYILSLSVSEHTVNQIMMAFLKITPVILLLIFVISIISAQIISKIVKGNETAIPEHTEKQIMSKETASYMLDLMRQTVEAGTGKKADTALTKIAGKTGTARVYDNKAGAYSTQNYSASFAGVFPAKDPKIAMIVVYESPKSSIYGGSTAANVFRQIAEFVSTEKHYFDEEIKVVSNEN